MPSILLVLIDMESVVEIMELPDDDEVNQQPPMLRLLDKSPGNGTGACFWRDCRFLGAVGTPKRALELAQSLDGVIPTSTAMRASSMEGTCLVYREVSRQAREEK